MALDAQVLCFECFFAFSFTPITIITVQILCFTLELFFFTVFMALFEIFLNFLQCNLTKFSHHIASSGIQILNMEKFLFGKGFSILKELLKWIS